MPIIVACPRCQGQLRVADNLIGQMVRCPACGTTFEGSAPPPADPPPEVPSMELPVETETIDAWKHLNLELTNDPPPSPPPENAPTLHGAREVPEKPTDDPPPTRRAGTGKRRPQLRDDHDDLRQCLNCGRMAHWNIRRCISCGAHLRDEDEDDAPPRGSRPVRRDCEPHRGGFILAMGITSLATTITCPTVAIVPALTAWILGTGDRARMRLGDMDPEGMETTTAGWICGIVATCINTALILGCLGMLGYVWQQTVDQSRNNPPRPVGFAAPAPPPAGPMPAPPAPPRP